MNKILADSGFQLDFLLDEESFEMWLDDVDVVTRFTAKLRPPNPSPRARADEINKLLIAEPESEETQVVMKSQRGLKARIQQSSALLNMQEKDMQTFSATDLKKGTLKFFDSTRRLLQAAMEVADDEDEDSICWKNRRQIPSWDIVAALVLAVCAWFGLDDRTIALGLETLPQAEVSALGTLLGLVIAGLAILVASLAGIGLRYSSGLATGSKVISFPSGMLQV